MNAVERLTAAIEKLEALKAEAFAGPWEALGSGVEHGDHWYVLSGRESILYISANDGSDEEFRQPTAELIVTLHRTIDAQLAILRWSLNEIEYENGEVVYYDEHTVALADAILGGDS